MHVPTEVLLYGVGAIYLLMGVLACALPRRGSRRVPQRAEGASQKRSFTT
jgi:hypothetical protein